MGRHVIGSALVVAALAGCGGSDGTTKPGEAAGWGAAQALGTADYLGSLAGDGNGNAVLVWIPPPATPDTGASIVARRFAPGTGWGPSQIVAPPGPNTFQSPVAAMDPRGVARALWPARRGLLTSQSTGSSWDAPYLISSESSSFQALPALGLPAPETALVVWTGGPGSVSNVSSNRLDPVLGWVSPETVWGTSARDVSAPALAVASNGLGLLAWAEGAESGARLWWSTFDPRRGWAVGQTVGLTGEARNMYGVRAAVNAAGQGMLVWTQDDTVFASRYTAVEGPGVPDGIGRGGCQGLAVDSGGNSIALVNQPLVPLAGLVLRVYRSGRWDEAPLVVAEDGSGAGALSMDARGNAWVVWANPSGVWARRYVAGQGLLAAQVVATGRFGLLPQVVAEADGGAIAAWLDRSNDAAIATILASRYAPP